MDHDGLIFRKWGMRPGQLRDSPTRLDPSYLYGVAQPSEISLTVMGATLMAGNAECGVRISILFQPSMASLLIRRIPVSRVPSLKSYFGE